MSRQSAQPYKRHPVTEGLEKFAPPGKDGEPGWGRWFRIAEVEKLSGQTVMEGPNGLPLLVLDRVGEGRIAVLASDQAWLWGRGYEGGGPQLRRLRRRGASRGCLRRMRSIVDALMRRTCAAAASSTCSSSRSAAIWRPVTVTRYWGVMRPEARQRRRNRAVSYIHLTLPTT